MTDTHETSTKHCQAKQCNDQMQCVCGLAWDMNDPEPPECPGATSWTHCGGCGSEFSHYCLAPSTAVCEVCEVIPDDSVRFHVNSAEDSVAQPSREDILREAELAKINETLSDQEDKHPSRTLQVRYDDLLAENAKLQRIIAEALAVSTGDKWVHGPEYARVVRRSLKQAGIPAASDRSQIETLLLRLSVPYTVEDDGATLRITHNLNGHDDSIISGYPGFFTDFEFNPDNSLKCVGAWE